MLGAEKSQRRRERLDSLRIDLQEELRLSNDLLQATQRRQGSFDEREKEKDKEKDREAGLLGGDRSSAGVGEELATGLGLGLALALEPECCLDDLMRGTVERLIALAAIEERHRVHIQQQNSSVVSAASGDGSWQRWRGAVSWSLFRLLPTSFASPVATFGSTCNKKLFVFDVGGTVERDRTWRMATVSDADRSRWIDWISDQIRTVKPYDDPFALLQGQAAPITSHQPISDTTTAGTVHITPGRARGGSLSAKMNSVRHQLGRKLSIKKAGSSTPPSPSLSTEFANSLSLGRNSSESNSRSSSTAAKPGNDLPLPTDSVDATSPSPLQKTTTILRTRSLSTGALGRWIRKET
ncbi:hypothetical protein BDR26DRAFT_913880 [Obelidium mucronatum]|nr:hypothetical protein BDR26DRAFT_913880 [Obelidium mucronatum]